MSTVKATNFQNASSATANMVTDASGNVSFGANATITGSLVPSSSFLRNRIINGDMRVDQRNAGASVTVNASGSTLFPVDRFFGSGTTSAGVYTLQRSTTVPTGFTNSIIATVTTADASISASDLYYIAQLIEGFNVNDLGWGTASAKTVTLSFWVRSSVTGTFGGAFGNSAYNRSYPFTYSISVANTFEYKTITIAGDTTGTWLTDNGIGLRVYWDLGSGVDNTGTANAWVGAGNVGADSTVALISTLSATFYITGVQLEVGTVATPFERQIYNAQLAQCQRYFETTYFSTPTAVPTNASNGYIPIPSAAVANGAQYAFVPFKVTKRASPTVTTYSYTSSTTSAASGLSGTDLAASSGVSAGATASHFWLANSSGASITPATGGFLIHYAATSEL